MGSKNEFSFWGRGVLEKTTEIVERAFAQAVDSVTVKVEVPGDFVRASALQSNSENLSVQSSNSSLISKAMAILLPAILVFLGSIFNLPVMALAVMAGLGGLVSMFIKSTVTVENQSSDKKLRPEDVKVTVLTDKNKATAFMTNAGREIEKLCREISDFENQANVRHNIATDRNFGNWVQRFLIFADNHPEERKIQQLREDLIGALAKMKIHVYDSLKLKANDTPDLPAEDYLIDSRKSKAYTKVVRPAVYSDELLLARGEIS